MDCFHELQMYINQVRRLFKNLDTSKVGIGIGNSGIGSQIRLDCLD